MIVLRFKIKNINIYPGLYSALPCGFAERILTTLNNKGPS
jgi:hypothetical protein